MTTLIDLDSSFRNRITHPDPSSFITFVSSFASAADQNDDDPVCDSMPLISWTGGQFQTNEDNLAVTGTIILYKSSDFVVVIKNNKQYQKAPNYYRGATLSFPDKTQRRITSSRYLPSGDVEFTIDTPVGTGTIQNFVFLVEPSDYQNQKGIEIFVPCGSPLQDFYTGMILYNESNGGYWRITGYKNFVIQIETTEESEFPVAPYQSFSIRKQLPVTDAEPQPALSDTTRVRFDIPDGFLSNTLLSHFLRNTSPKYGNAANANAKIIPRIVAWDETLKIATVNPPFAINPPINTRLELLPITSFNFQPFINIRYAHQDTSYYNVKLLSLNVPQNSNIRDYSYVYVRLASLHTSSGKHLFISNNPNSALAQFRATLTPTDKSSTFCKLSGDDSVQLMQINTNDAIEFTVILPDGKNLVYSEPEAFSPAPPNPLTQISAFFSITLQPEVNRRSWA